MKIQWSERHTIEVYHAGCLGTAARSRAAVRGRVASATGAATAAATSRGAGPAGARAAARILLTIALLGTLATWARPAEADRLPPRGDGDLELDLFLESSVSTRAHFDPVSLAADVRLLLDEHVTLALEHSATAADLGELGRGVCLRDERCPARYTPPTFAVGYRLEAPTWRLEPRAALATRGMAPFRLALELGVAGSVRVGRGTIMGAAAWWRGLHLREQGNADRVHLSLRYWRPVGAGAQRAGLWWAVGTGMRSALDTFPDAVRVPLGVALAYRTHTWDLGIDYELARILGSLNDYKPRYLTLFVTVRPEIALRRRSSGWNTAR